MSALKRRLEELIETWRAYNGSTVWHDAADDLEKVLMSNSKKGWIGVDLDGTLAYYDKFVSPLHIGEPIPVMRARVKATLEQGYEVRILTARVCSKFDDRLEVQRAIEDWVLKHIGRRLIVTSEKDHDMIELWDDRAVGVEKNTGKFLSEPRKLK